MSGFSWGTLRAFLYLLIYEVAKENLERLLEPQSQLKYINHHHADLFFLLIIEVLFFLCALSVQPLRWNPLTLTFSSILSILNAKEYKNTPARKAGSRVLFEGVQDLPAIIASRQFASKKLIPFSNKTAKLETGAGSRGIQSLKTISAYSACVTRLVDTPRVVPSVLILRFYCKVVWDLIY